MTGGYDSIYQHDERLLEFVWLGDNRVGLKKFWNIFPKKKTIPGFFTPKKRFSLNLINTVI